MTEIKKKYVKPQIMVIEVEPQQILSMSGDVNKANELDPYTEGFE